jgi:nitric oxide reductase NorD protein
MNFVFWKKKSGPKQQAKTLRTRSTAKYGGMQERVIQARLEIFVDAVLKRKRSVISTARALSEFSLIDQERFLHSVDRISLINQELAFRFCMLATPALAELSDTAWEHWIDSLLDSFNKNGIEAGIASIEAFHAYQHDQTPGSGSVAFTEISRVLEIFIRALNGREIKLATAEQSYTDTETMFLPPHINRYKTRDENFLLYKSLLVHQWAQTWFGTWHVDLNDALKEYSDPDHALQLFHSLETLRLDACLERELPGIAREMARFRSKDKLTHPLWVEAKLKLQLPDADALTSLNCLPQLYTIPLQQNDALYQGQLRTEETIAVMAERRSRELQALQKNLGEIHDGMVKKKPSSTDHSSSSQPGFNITQANQENVDESLQNQLEYEGKPVDVTPEMQTLLDSMVQDNYEIPQHYMDASETDIANAESEPVEISAATNNEVDHQFCYDEWDHARQSYRKKWCLLNEQSVTPVTGHFVSDTLNKYHILLKQLRRTFEALRQENHQVKREPFGDDIDIDAAVEAWADTSIGLEASERLFIQTRREDRNVAVMFMIDMSASTTGWINRVERESLVLLCEALELLGDRYAIYGFSGHSHKNCQSYHIKDFDENYSDEVRNRIQGIQPQDYTRMGAAIRHLGCKLSREEARTRLLITLSDGRPDDIGGYRGPYGIEDTRMALIEMKHLGIHPYCITIDTNARDYISHMFGKNDFTIISEVDKLPQKIADIYRRLTH